MKKPHFALEALSLSKYFGSFCALNKVSLELKKGSVHALLGENGAGKSTLVKCIMGYHKPDQGELLIDNKQVSISNPRDAHKLGVGMVYQHFTLVPNMSVAENLILSRLKLPSIINWKEELAQLEHKMQSMPFDIPLNNLVSSLSAGEKQKVEILKQLLLDIKLLILDEPTSVLTPSEADEVLGQIRERVLTSDLSVILITHKFREVMQFADEVTVLRRGNNVGFTAVDNSNPDDLAQMMMGKRPDVISLHREQSSDQNILLKVKNLKVNNDRGTLAIDNLALQIKRGEILGLAGVSGNGQRELIEFLAGQRHAQSGEVFVNEEAYKVSRKQIRESGFYCLPEEPLRNACVDSMSVAENLVLHEFDRPPFVYLGFIVNRSAINANARKLVERFSIRASSISTPIGNLSGGNVQRTVLARELSNKLNVLVIANPCFGLDFNAVAEIRTRIMQARNDGAAVLLLSEDLDEILELSDRIGVISRGNIVYETTPENADLTTIGKFMAGH